MAANWPCQFVNVKGVPCESEALFRLHFSLDHPFDHVDVCNKHFGEYKFYFWFQRLLTPEQEEKERQEKESRWRKEQQQ